MYLSVVVPAYNEEKRIEKTLIEIDAYLRLQKYDYEIIVVNDGSADRTVEVVEKLRVKNLRLINNKENKGKGFVVRQGLLAGKGEYRLFTDADNSVSINQVEKFMPYFKQGYGAIIASRSVKGAVLSPAQPWLRHFLGDIFSVVAKIMTGFYGIRDTQCGFKIFSAKLISNILPKCKINRWAFDVEVLALAKKFGYKIKEVPVIWRNNIYSKVDFKGMIESLSDLIKIRLNFLFNQYEL